MVNIELEEQQDKSLDQMANVSLIKSGNEITEKIIAEEDPDKLKELTQLFTLNRKKKEIARINKLSTLQDLIDDEVISRMTVSPESFDNEQLEKYMRSVQLVMANLNDKEDDLPQILINNQTNVNINSSGLDRESRKRVYDAVQSILKDNNVIDIVPDSKGDR